MKEPDELMEAVKAFDKMSSTAGFDIVPVNDHVNLDKDKYIQLKINDEQKINIFGLMHELPGAMVAGALTQTYVCKFPEGIPHTLTKLKQGGWGSMVRNDTGFVGTASFYQTTAEAALLGAFTVMSFASGQYFLAKINNGIRIVNSKLDKILDFLYGEKKAELMSEIAFIQQAYKNYNSIMAHEQQRVATIISIQEAKKIAIKDIDFYINDLESKVNETGNSYSDLGSIEKNAEQAKKSLDTAIQLYLMSNLLEIYYAQNFDRDYLTFLEEEMSLYISKCNASINSNFSILKEKINAYKKKLTEKDEKKELLRAIEEILIPLKDGEEQKIHKTIRETLHVPEKSNVLYLTPEGNVYIEAI